jgi:hypothetical protein
VRAAASFDEQNVRIANQVFGMAAENFVNEPLYGYRLHYEANRPNRDVAASPARARAVPGSTRRRYEHSLHANVREAAHIVRDAAPLDLYLQFVRHI